MPTTFLHGVEVIEISDGIRPIRTVRSSVIGIVGTAEDADAAAFPLNTPVLVLGPRQASALGAGGTLKDAYTAIYQQGVSLAIVVRVAEGVDAAATQANVVGDALQQTGVYALLVAESVTKFKPRLLVAPGFTSDRPGNAANPVTDALNTVAGRLRAVAFVDGPNTNITDALAYEGDWDSDRFMIIDPHVLTFDSDDDVIVTRPSAAYFAGIQAFLDNTKGFWHSVSNKPINGVLGTNRPIGFGLSDTEAEANLMNEGNVSTIVHQDGYRTWGNRSPATDPLWSFLSVRRTADMIYDSIERGQLWAMDRPMTAQLIKDVRDSVQAYIDQLVLLGALVGGRCWFDPELNPETELVQGKLRLDFDIEPTPPMEHLTFGAHRNIQYFETLALSVAATNVEAA